MRHQLIPVDLLACTKIGPTGKNNFVFPKGGFKHTTLLARIDLKGQFLSRKTWRDSLSLDLSVS